MDEISQKGIYLYTNYYIEPKKRRRSSKREKIEFLEVIMLHYIKIERSWEATIENSEVGRIKC